MIQQTLWNVVLMEETVVDLISTLNIVVTVNVLMEREEEVILGRG